MYTLSALKMHSLILDWVWRRYWLSHVSSLEMIFFGLLHRFSSDKSSTGSKDHSQDTKMTTEVKETKEQLKKRLTALAYQVTQEAGTERPFTGNLFNMKYKNVYFNLLRIFR